MAIATRMRWARVEYQLDLRTPQRPVPLGVVVVDEKAPACQIPLHVRHLPIYDYREALRASTRVHHTEHEDFEEEG